MIIDRFKTDTQSLGDFLVGAARRDEAEDLPLPRCQLDIRFFILQEFKDFRRDHLCTAQDKPYTVSEMFRITSLHEQTVNARGDEFAQKPDCRETCENNDPGVGAPAPHFAENLDPLGVRHGDVERQKVRLVLTHEADSLKPVFGLTGNAHPAGRAEYLLDTRAHQCMIIGNDRRYISIFRWVMSHGLLIPSLSPLRRLAHLAVLACVMLCATIAGAATASMAADAETVNLQTGDYAQDLAPYVRYLEDAGKSMSIDQILSLDRRQDFKPVETKLVDFGFKRSRFWLRFPVRNASAEKASWKLAIEFPYIEYLAVYLVHPEGTKPPRYKQLLTYDETRPFADRILDYRYFAPDITLNPGEKADILIAYSSKQATQLPLSIESLEHFLQRIRGEDLVNWSLLILLIGMTIVSTVYLIALGFGTAVYYGIYVLLSALYLFHTDGYAFQYLWPDWPNWNNVAVAPIGLVMVASGSLFARSFVNAPAFFPRLNKLLLGTVFIVILLMAASPWLIQNDAYKTGSLLFVIVCAVFYFAAGILAVRRGQAGARFFLAGSVAIISTILFGIYGYLNPGEFNQDIAGLYGRFALFFEGIAFSLAIFLHIQAMRGAHDEALQREIETTREKLAISEALQKAEKNHEKAIAIAEARRARLATTAHDIKQPLMSLRMSLIRLKADDEAASAQISSSFDYLDELVRSNLEETAPASMTEDTVGEGNENALSEADPHATVESRIGELEQFPVMVVLSNVIAMFREEAREKGLTLKLIPSSGVVESQPVAMMRIVSNLVSNAIKYTESGTVLVGCRRDGKSLRIEIHDTGPGMDQAEISRIMKPYERGETPGGTGLGLAVVDELARYYGMTFDITSTPGAGTMTKLIVPPQQAAMASSG